jgi:hypothetical protein
MAWGSQGQVFLGEDLMSTRDYSDETARIIDEEVETILRQCEQQCEDVLTEYRNSLDLVARGLLEHETISGAEVRRLVGLGHNPQNPGDGSTPPANGSGNGHVVDQGAPSASPAPPSHHARGDAPTPPPTWPYIDEGGSSV